MTDKPAGAPDADAARHAPFTIPAGAFEASDLQKLGEQALKAKPEDRDRVIQEGLAAANQGLQVETSGLPEGYKIVEVARDDVAEGLVENVRVYDPKLAAEQEKEEEKAEKDLPVAPVPGTGTGELKDVKIQGDAKPAVSDKE